MLEIKEKIDVLDKGFVGLIDQFGNDERIVDCARISYQKGTKHVSSTEQLLDYLIRKQHTSPLEMVEFIFLIKAPIFVIVHFLRHRTASVNSESGRYSVLTNDVYIPKEERLRKQDLKNKQASSNEQIENIEKVKNLIENICNESNKVYSELLENELSRELSRAILPLNTYMTLVWKIDLNNLFKFLKLRISKEAQEETSDYAKAIYNLIKNRVPLSIKAFEEHILYSQNFSKTELKTLNQIIQDKNSLKNKAKEFGLKENRIKEFLGKLDV